SGSEPTPPAHPLWLSFRMAWHSRTTIDLPRRGLIGGRGSVDTALDSFDHVRGSRAGQRFLTLRAGLCPSENENPSADAATVLFPSDDHCPIRSAAILRMRDTDPLRAVQQQVGAMCSGIDPLFLRC